MWHTSIAWNLFTDKMKRLGGDSGGLKKHAKNRKHTIITTQFFFGAIVGAVTFYLLNIALPWRPSSTSGCIERDIFTHASLESHGLNSGKSSLGHGVDQRCFSQISKVLTDAEKSYSLDALICSSQDLAELVLKDRSKIKQHERKEYLREIRSYRLSGLVCNDHLDPSIPAVATEAAFKCLPGDYKRRACMDGRLSFPSACSTYADFRKGGQYIPEIDRSEFNDGISRCDTDATNCIENPMGIINGGTTVAEGQLAKGVPATKILTMRSDGRPVWRPEALDLHLRMIKNGEDVSPLDYLGAHKAIQNAVDTIDVKNKTAGVFGSITPWVESILFHNNVKIPITTVDYNLPLSYDDRLVTKLMSKLLLEDDQFQVVVSYSSIEHDGQGRYDDPLDPDGDLTAMKEIWLKVAPGGHLLLNVPIGEDSFFWFSQRIYGKDRIPVLLSGWQYVGLATSTRVYGSSDEFLIGKLEQNNNVFVLKKPENVGADEKLDRQKSSRLRCDINGKCSSTYE